MKELFIKTEKAFISTLPRFSFEGRIIVVQGQSEAVRAVHALRKAPLLGIDTETRPNFRPGKMHPVALLQIATRELCFLFRLNFLGFPPALIDLLADPDITKVGLSLRDDFQRLGERHSFVPHACIDIQDDAKQMGITDMSLQKLFANVFRQRISKNAQLSNWEADVLTQKQKVYAATDAYACVCLYDELRRLRESGDYRLLPPIEKNSQSTN
ncbi:MAG: 3'-5' exonuclease domain-containing protein 2 [Prevotella sp.]|nr:3'-5' exonuclease domain-containing protein 2 [Prevotella sp.]